MQTEFEYLHRFAIRSESSGAKQRFHFRDSLSPSTARIIEGAVPTLSTRNCKLSALRMLIPPSVAHSPLKVRDLPESLSDAHFWQFPAITEAIAFARHHELPLPSWHPELSGPVHTYLGLPWASYIDKEAVPENAKLVFGTRLRGYRSLAAFWELAWGTDVQVHTVCQHIYWPRLLPLWAELGITDLHLSHCTPKSEARALAYGIRVHSWPLVAPNVVNPERRLGLTVGKPLDQRSLLASFIGAHMPHYRSDVRLRLREEAIENANDDIVFELKDDWHFNALVYGEQVAGKKADTAAAGIERESTEHYNRVLSDSVFALCPEGAGPNTLRLWEAMAVGAIPVVMVDDWIWPQLPGGEVAWTDAVIPLRRDDTRGLFARLRALLASDPDRLARMQAAGMALYERFGKMRCFE